VNDTIIQNTSISYIADVAGCAVEDVPINNIKVINNKLVIVSKNRKYGLCARILDNNVQKKYVDLRHCINAYFQKDYVNAIYKDLHSNVNKLCYYLIFLDRYLILKVLYSELLRRTVLNSNLLRSIRYKDMFVEFERKNIHLYLYNVFSSNMPYLILIISYKLVNNELSFQFSMKYCRTFTVKSYFLFGFDNFVRDFIINNKTRIFAEHERGALSADAIILTEAICAK
jgi:hypothetical protein